jgi:hypothetical protein
MQRFWSVFLIRIILLTLENYLKIQNQKYFDIVDMKEYDDVLNLYQMKYSNSLLEVWPLSLHRNTLNAKNSVACFSL